MEANADTMKSKHSPNIEAPLETEGKRYKSLNDLSRDYGLLHDHSKDQLLGNTIDLVRTHPSLRNICVNLELLSQIELKNF